MFTNFITRAGRTRFYHCSRERHAGGLRYNGRRLKTPHLFMKKSRIALFACLLLGSFLTAGCTLYKNPSTCKAQMRAAAAHALPHDKLSITHVGVGIHGSRVVVEGTFQSPPVAASAAAAASAPTASAPTASAPTASAPTASSSVAAPSGVHASEAHSSRAHASATHASASAAASKPTNRAAAVECSFKGDALTTWHWLSPPELAKPADPAKSDETQHTEGRD
jgi:hypothetical protein